MQTIYSLYTHIHIYTYTHIHIYTDIYIYIYISECRWHALAIYIYIYIYKRFSLACILQYIISEFRWCGYAISDSRSHAPFQQSGSRSYMMSNFSYISIYTPAGISSLICFCNLSRYRDLCPWTTSRRCGLVWVPLVWCSPRWKAPDVPL